MMNRVRRSPPSPMAPTRSMVESMSAGSPPLPRGTQQVARHDRRGPEADDGDQQAKEQRAPIDECQCHSDPEDDGDPCATGVAQPEGQHENERNPERHASQAWRRQMRRHEERERRRDHQECAEHVRIAEDRRQSCHLAEPAARWLEPENSRRQERLADGEHGRTRDDREHCADRIGRLPKREAHEPRQEEQNGGIQREEQAEGGDARRHAVEDGRSQRDQGECHQRDRDRVPECLRQASIKPCPHHDHQPDGEEQDLGQEMGDRLERRGQDVRHDVAIDERAQDHDDQAGARPPRSGVRSQQDEPGTERTEHDRRRSGGDDRPDEQEKCERPHHERGDEVPRHRRPQRRALEFHVCGNPGATRFGGARPR